MKQHKIFERGKGDWEKLFDFMDQNDFSCADMLAVVCANIHGLPQKEFKTNLMVAGQVFDIQITKHN